MSDAPLRIGCENPFCKFVERAETEEEAQAKKDRHHAETGHKTHVQDVGGYYDHSDRKADDAEWAEEKLEEILRKGDSSDE